ncbi:protein FAR1-RELATED SEQUENCE 5-like [Trifolium pratense]|uniref:Uncharacterized protein n=1 Tax=Trifolium pratense TaxID=57577 RepID=A0ACB0L4W5_TRIPR|nr:protein FAR1-RELATED SEQUENCE 5-like [Trifolium pratense]CAJ2664161.1 unnamed protein product [Trifolium pratense]
METEYEEQICSPTDNSCEGLETESGTINMKFDYKGHRIPINGVEDMGGLNFKKFTPAELLQYDFPNREVAFTFYNWYSRMHGFSARKNRIRRNKDQEVVQQEFVCYRQGFREDRFKDNKIRQREAKVVTRCGCEAKCTVHFDHINQRWYVRWINDYHNHPFVEEKFIGFLPGHRGMDDDDILQMNHHKKSGIRTSQIFGSFANQVGGYEHVTFSVQDMYNAVDKERRSKGTDSRAALAYLRSLKSSDPTMYWKHTVDKQGRLEHLFWSDGRSQMDYNIFGDVLAFDATYKKNRYLCPLVIFSGVNHHNQTTVFATAIVANETEETYVWLLECLLEVMNGKMPKSVITDGDLAMKNAIRRVFPNAHHRLCAWHLIRNATSNVKSNRFTHLFRKLMLCDYELVDFERKWNDMVTECGVEDNNWVLDMYEKKEMWATAHIRGKFFGGFRTTSRCEGLHAKIGKFVNYRNNLTEFLQHFNQCIEYLRYKELEADYLSMHGERVTQTEFHLLEKNASKVYTKNVFFLFRTIMQKSSAVKVVGCKQTASCFIYIVNKYCRSDSEWHVSYWPVSMEIKCSCLRMESIGIPCDHIVCVMVYLNMVEIPSSLVLDRWTKNVKDLSNYTRQGQSGGWDSMSVCRYKSLNQRCREINSLVCKNPEAYAETIELLNDHYGHVKSKYEVQDEGSDKMEGHNERYLQNPVIARTKGRGGNVAGRAGNKRKKSQCGFCGIVGHNKQTCAAFKKQKKTVDKSDVDDDEEDDGGGDDDDDDDDDDYR